MNKSLIKISIVLAVMISFSSCKIHKEYTAPEINIEDTYSHTKVDSTSFGNIAWWDLFNDPTLTSLIQKGLEENVSLKSIISTVKQTQIQLDITKTQLYPSINYGVTGDVTKSTASSELSDNVNAAINVSYTLDVWGRIKNQNEAALQAYLATEIAYFEVRATLIAQIATYYFTLRDVDNKVIVAEKMINSLANFRDIIAARYKGGFISKVDLNQANIQLKEAEITLQSLIRARKQLENGLNVLLGTTMEPIERGLLLQQQLPISEFPTGVPADLLERRPSILIAERELKAQLAVIGATEALKYPNFTLSLDVGAQVTNPSAFFSKLTANLLGPIFNKGRINQSIELEKEKYNQLVYNYEQSYLVAFQEVEDALIAIETYKTENKFREEQLGLSEEALKLAWVRYNEGITSFLEFINLQNSLFNAQLKSSESYKLQLESIVKLYLALGGGWNENN